MHSLQPIHKNIEKHLRCYKTLFRQTKILPVISTSSYKMLKVMNATALLIKTRAKENKVKHICARICTRKFVCLLPLCCRKSFLCIRFCMTSFGIGYFCYHVCVCVGANAYGLNFDWNIFFLPCVCGSSQFKTSLNFVLKTHSSKQLNNGIQTHAHTHSNTH